MCTWKSELKQLPAQLAPPDLEAPRPRLAQWDPRDPLPLGGLLALLVPLNQPAPAAHPTLVARAAPAALGFPELRLLRGRLNTKTTKSTIKAQLGSWTVNYS